ncbi:cytochrome d ubiquinol oxidase subunit II [Rubellimicrobium roseum]|uniref:Cytochrome d ubiquinol oxidase subunit II n=1 Tax=Rubellimicrobium roseum TaxID=687525 RepID=A0A5C4N778_9RHOB|nr:cytochrome d ubiquinol oxidase subunit II [Rubellimicrobium roseum]TNC65799.1 cytochrome d ubiquinol oxidase subunit II [Rubellimicrobium roseum]
MELFGLAPATWLPVVFAGLMGLAILMYVVLDGYDLGVGLLLGGARDEGERDAMIASIGPFWDANETWLVLATGLLLVAFPLAHGEILTALYLPVALMLVGLVARGVAFKFRTKMAPGSKLSWDRAFLGGSLLAALAQGWMLGSYILGFRGGWDAHLFAAVTALGLAAAYGFIGACWLLLKAEGELQRRAAVWARGALLFAGLGLVAVSVATPLVSERVFDKWFSLPNVVLLAPIPVVTGLLLAGLWVALARYPRPGDRWAWVPFAGAVAVFGLAFQGLAFSFYPYVVPGSLTIWDAAAAPESLGVILVGSVFVLPMILAYTAFSYWVFRGKLGELRYE